MFLYSRDTAHNFDRLGNLSWRNPSFAHVGQWNVAVNHSTSPRRTRHVCLYQHPKTGNLIIPPPSVVVSTLLIHMFVIDAETHWYDHPNRTHLWTGWMASLCRRSRSSALFPRETPCTRLWSNEFMVWASCSHFHSPRRPRLGDPACGASKLCLLAIQRLCTLWRTCARSPRTTHFKHIRRVVQFHWHHAGLAADEKNWSKAWSSTPNAHGPNAIFLLARGEFKCRWRWTTTVSHVVDIKCTSDGSICPSCMLYRLLNVSSVVDRLRAAIAWLEEHETAIHCVGCHARIADTTHIFCTQQAQASSLSSVSMIGTFVNPHGAVHQMLTLIDLALCHIMFTSEPTLRETWFPGYTWQCMHCIHCQTFLGWRYQTADDDVRRLEPKVFYGLVRTALG